MKKNSAKLHSCSYLYSMLMPEVFADEDKICPNNHNCLIRFVCGEFKCLNVDKCSRDNTCSKVTCPDFTCVALDESSC